MLQVGMRCFLPDRCLSAGRFLQVLPAEKREMLTGTPEGVSQDAAACAMYAQAQELLPEVLVTAQIINHSKTANLFFFFHFPHTRLGSFHVAPSVQAARDKRGLTLGLSAHYLSTGSHF